MMDGQQFQSGVDLKCEKRKSALFEDDEDFLNVGKSQKERFDGYRTRKFSCCCHLCHCFILNFTI